MTLTNYCKKCKRETPPGDTCAHCGTKLTRAGERLAFTLERTPLRDWFSWNAMLRVVVPVIGLVFLVTVIAEAMTEGSRGVQLVFVQGFFWTLLYAFGLMLLAIGLLLTLQGKETVRYVLGSKSASAYVYLYRPHPIRLYARLMTPASVEAMQAEAPEPLGEGYVFVRGVELPWSMVKRAGYWPETQTVLLYSPRYWQAMHIRCGIDTYEQTVAIVQKKVRGKKKPVKKKG